MSKLAKLCDTFIVNEEVHGLKVGVAGRILGITRECRTTRCLKAIIRICRIYLHTVRLDNLVT